MRGMFNIFHSNFVLNFSIDFNYFFFIDFLNLITVTGHIENIRFKLCPELAISCRCNRNISGLAGADDDCWPISNVWTLCANVHQSGR